MCNFSVNTFVDELAFQDFSDIRPDINTLKKCVEVYICMILVLFLSMCCSIELVHCKEYKISTVLWNTELI